LSDIDLDSGYAYFEQAADFTVGLERSSRSSIRRTSAWWRGSRSCVTARSPTDLSDAIAGELISSEIEIRSGRGETYAAAVNAQRDVRRRMFELAAAHDVLLGATGTHPWADYREQHIIDNRPLPPGRGRAEVRRLAQQHVLHARARRDSRRRPRGADLRPVAAVLPLLLAISANSPFLEGRDAGLHSMRSQIFTKSFPRCGVPDAFGSWESFAQYIDFLVRTSSIVEYTQVGRAAAPHVGTVEVRICDAQATAAESEALAALIVACVAQAARDRRRGNGRTRTCRRG